MEKSTPINKNRRPVLIGVSSDDKETPVPVAVNPSTGAVIVELV